MLGPIHSHCLTWRYINAWIIRQMQAYIVLHVSTTPHLISHYVVKNNTYDKKTPLLYSRCIPNLVDWPSSSWEEDVNRWNLVDWPSSSWEEDVNRRRTTTNAMQPIAIDHLSNLKGTSVCNQLTFYACHARKMIIVKWKVRCNFCNGFAVFYQVVWKHQNTSNLLTNHLQVDRKIYNIYIFFNPPYMWMAAPTPPSLSLSLSLSFSLSLSPVCILISTYVLRFEEQRWKWSNGVSPTLTRMFCLQKISQNMTYWLSIGRLYNCNVDNFEFTGWV